MIIEVLATRLDDLIRLIQSVSENINIDVHASTSIFSIVSIDQYAAYNYHEILHLLKTSSQEPFILMTYGSVHTRYISSSYKPISHEHHDSTSAPTFNWHEQSDRFKVFQMMQITGLRP